LDFILSCDFFVVIVLDTVVAEASRRLCGHGWGFAAPNPVGVFDDLFGHVFLNVALFRAAVARDDNRFLAFPAAQLLATQVVGDAVRTVAGRTGHPDGHEHFSYKSPRPPTVDGTKLSG